MRHHKEVELRMRWSDCADERTADSWCVVRYSILNIMNMLQKIYYFFSRYTDPAERRVGRFFARVNEKNPPHMIEKSLLHLLQRDIAVINLWTERQYKGYQYLTKRERRHLYDNLAAIQRDFAVFAATQSVDLKQVIAQIASKGVDTAMLRTRPEQLTYITILMRYLSPTQGRYEYRNSSSFGRLLRDPRREKLIGDCNQIVTLYIALFAAKYDVSDMKLTLYPGHVALHFHGVDIETTNGTFAAYDREGQITAPIHEIVSVNLLDTTDSNFTKNAVNPEIFLQAARLAYVVSSHRQLVKKNLEIAYHNVVQHLMKTQKYPAALTYARQSKNYELIEAAARNGAIHAMKQQKFTEARACANASQNRHELLRTIDSHEAAQLYNTKHYDQARKIYQRLGQRDMVGQCYRGLYIQEQNKLGPIKTTADVKANAGTIRAMERYAKLSGDTGLMTHARALVKHL